MRARVVALLLLAVGCSQDLPEATATPGQPVPGLAAAERAHFNEGEALFDRDFSEPEGLGPLFNQRRCSSCHDIPTPGGNGTERVTKVTRFDPPDRCDLLEAQGGELLQSHATTALDALGVRGERVPEAATAVVSMHAPPLYGLGLIEAIPETAILQAADPGDSDGDGISGRAVRLPDGRLGRFGRKLRFATIRDFVDDALRDELGITTPTHSTESTLNGAPLPDGIDTVADPEVGDSVVDRITAYIRLLAAPDRETPRSGAAADSIAQGRIAFGRIGCAACHTPTLETTSAVAALNDRTVTLYSDLLLHDLGEELASICGPSASPSEWRTAPLLGLRHRTALLHDGSTQSLRGVIEAHGGEGAASRLQFLSLPPETQAMLLRFLSSL